MSVHSQWRLRPLRHGIRRRMWSAAQAVACFPVPRCLPASCPDRRNPAPPSISGSSVDAPQNTPRPFEMCVSWPTVSTSASIVHPDRGVPRSDARDRGMVTATHPRKAPCGLRMHGPHVIDPVTATSRKCSVRPHAGIPPAPVCLGFTRRHCHWLARQSGLRAARSPADLAP